MRAWLESTWVNSADWTWDAHTCLDSLKADNIFRGKKHSHKVKEEPAEPQTQDCVKTQTWGRILNISSNASKSSVASVVLEWKTFGTITSCPCNQSMQGDGSEPERWLRTWWPLRLTCGDPLMEMGETSRRTITAALHWSGAWLKPPSQFAKKWKTPQGFKTVGNKSLCSDETKIEQFGLNSKYHVWRTHSIAHHLRVGAWWCQQHGAGVHYSGRDRKTGQNQVKAEWSMVQRYP